VLAAVVVLILKVWGATQWVVNVVLLISSIYEVVRHYLL